MPCTKKQYTKLEAQGALNIMLAVHATKKGRIYHCDECRAWHVTSIPEKSYKDYTSIGRKPLKMESEFKKYLA